jgi:hypothetical protein
MEIGHRVATSDDIDVMAQLYEPAVREQAALREAWPIADGLAEPATDTLAALLAG